LERVMSVNPAIRVGIIVILALVAFGTAYWFLTGYGIRRDTYHVKVVFDDARGLVEGSRVTMAGVNVGLIDSIYLNKDLRAVVDIIISNKYRIPQGSRFILRVGLLVGDKYIDIVPNRMSNVYIAHGSTVEGVLPPRIEDLLPQAQAVLANLQEVSAGLKNVLGDETVQAQLKGSVANINLATSRLAESMSQVQLLISSQSGSINQIVGNVAQASTNLRNLTSEINNYIKSGGLKENIEGTLQAARSTAESLNRTTASLEKLVADPKFQEDIRQTVAGARRTVEEAERTLNRIQGILGGGGGRGGAGTGISMPTRATTLDTIFRPSDSKFRADVNTTLPLSGGFLRIGVYDLGGDNKLTLQPGRPIGPRTDLRYGIYASKLGLGLDHSFSDKTYGSLNLYDTESAKLDAMAGYNLTNDFGLLLGVDQLFKENKFTFGARLTR
jgi:ABC-type transporter Mla subunit MlaD